jgi:hypothetical protein
MPRIARRAADGGVYHILNRGNGQQRVFHKDADYLYFLRFTDHGSQDAKPDTGDSL